MLCLKCFGKLNKESFAFRKRFYVYAFIVVCIMGVIFFFSSQAEEESMESSNYALGLLIGFEEHVIPVWGSWFLKQKIRKVAHFLIYMLLGLFLTLTIKETKVATKICPIISWGIASLYACTDEFHQHFVSGRSAQVSDVILDSCGAIFGISIVMLVAFQKYQVKRRLKED